MKFKEDSTGCLHGVELLTPYKKAAIVIVNHILKGAYNLAGRGGGRGRGGGGYQQGGYGGGGGGGYDQGGYGQVLPHCNWSQCTAL